MLGGLFEVGAEAHREIALVDVVVAGGDILDLHRLRKAETISFPIRDTLAV
jgi:hypothetical protein